MRACSCWQLVEFGTDFVGVGAAAEFLEDRQGSLPGITGGRPVAGGEMDVAEISERPAFRWAVAEFPPPGDGPLVVGAGQGLLAEVVCWLWE
ncbi:hypothetical protein GCM10010174_66720 [Kutzneria viridogrisea]|uniref:Uncharacterized protein n=1 Tax=Kutzneria viridogrisea TaxID=47990 RepID=A0ABR6B9W1_9PSEU|nr:hypothetical protein [Kutzneria viridogrisea]